MFHLCILARKLRKLEVRGYLKEEGYQCQTCDQWPLINVMVRRLWSAWGMGRHSFASCLSQGCLLMGAKWLLQMQRISLDRYSSVRRKERPFFIAKAQGAWRCWTELSDALATGSLGRVRVPLARLRLLGSWWQEEQRMECWVRPVWKRWFQVLATSQGLLHCSSPGQTS